MVTAPTHVYRSTDADLVAALTRLDEMVQAFPADTDAVAQKYPIAGTVREPQCRYSTFDGSRWMAGLDTEDSDELDYRRSPADMPYPGWKYNRKLRCWVPDRRTELGKEISRALPFIESDAQVAQRIAGMPMYITVSHNASTGATRAMCATLTVTDGVVTAACPGHPFDGEEPPAKFTTLWHPVKLSDYYAEQGL